MTSWATRLLRRKTRTYNPRPRIPFRPRLEVLEDRVTPTLTDHGGAVLASVQVQAVYLGSSWNASPISTTVFDSFLNSLVSNTPSGQAPYLAMLHNAGFAGVTGNGSALTGVQDNVNVPSTITDSQIQADLQAEIRSSAVQQPNTQTLYEVFVQPGAVVSIGNNETSVNTFLAYHSSFSANGALVRYAVVPFHGTAGNAQAPWLNQLDSMTVAASHETAEAITDPDGHTYYDRSGNEIGDVVNGSTVYLNGYAVQREGSLPASLSNFLPMTPAGATAGHSTTFAIGSGALQVNGVGVANPSGETGKVVAISTQGIDDFGQPMVDVVFSDGKAYEYHDFLPNNPTAVANPSFFPWTYLSANVKLVPAGQGYSAVAGQGVSYVLLTNGALGEYVDPNYFTYYYGFGVNPGARYGAIATGVTSIIATHTDPLGVNAVDYTVVVRGKTTTYESARRDRHGLHNDHGQPFPQHEALRDSRRQRRLLDLATGPGRPAGHPGVPGRLVSHGDCRSVSDRLFRHKSERDTRRRAAAAVQPPRRRRVGRTPSRRRDEPHAVGRADNSCRRSGGRAAVAGSGRPAEGGSVDDSSGSVAGATADPRRPARRPEGDAPKPGAGAEPAQRVRGERPVGPVRFWLRRPDPRGPATPPAAPWRRAAGVSRLILPYFRGAMLNQPAHAGRSPAEPPRGRSPTQGRR